VITSGSPAGSGGGPAAARDGIADYQFIRMLGAGNHGVYYLASRPERLGPGAELVAVKVLSGVSSQDTFRRATRELAAFAAVSSPDLVTLYDAGQQGEELYYSMEYFPSGSLAEPAQPAPRQAALSAVAGAARAAHALHEAGIAHNDIKPGNVMLPDDGGGKLADLGLSRVLTPGMTVSGLGSTASVEYLDPAVLRGAAPSRASDIFALGATLHRALASCPATMRWWRCAGCCPASRWCLAPSTRRRATWSAKRSATTPRGGRGRPWSWPAASRRWLLEIRGRSGTVAAGLAAGRQRLARADPAASLLQLAASRLGDGPLLLRVCHVPEQVL